MAEFWSPQLQLLPAGADDAESCPVESDVQVDRDVKGLHFVVVAITCLPCVLLLRHDDS